MLYILETKLPEAKSIFFSLQYVFGLGKFESFKICKRLGFSRNFEVKSLTDIQIKQLVKLTNSLSLVITSDLKKLKNLVVKRLVTIKSYRGLRKIKGLPIRGQRTHTNAKTVKKIRT